MGGLLGGGQEALRDDAGAGKEGGLMGRHVMEAKCCEESRRNQVCRNVEIRNKKKEIYPQTLLRYSVSSVCDTESVAQDPWATTIFPLISYDHLSFTELHKMRDLHLVR